MLMQWQSPPQINMSKHFRISLRLRQKPALQAGCKIRRFDFIFAFKPTYLGFHIFIVSQKILLWP